MSLGSNRARLAPTAALPPRPPPRRHHARRTCATKAVKAPASASTYTSGLLGLGAWRCSADGTKNDTVNEFLQKGPALAEMRVRTGAVMGILRASSFWPSM